MPTELMDANELRAWFRYIEYQNRLIMWMLASQNPKNKMPRPTPPTPPEGIVK